MQQNQTTQQKKEPLWKQEARRAAKERNFIGINVSEDADPSAISDALPSSLLFPSETIINSKETIRIYGERLEFLCKVNNIKHKTLAGEITRTIKTTEGTKTTTKKLSAQTITNITKGALDSVNIDFCNQFAQFFQCSAYYLMGYTDYINGTTMDGQSVNLPFIVTNLPTSVKVIQASWWATLDPELFQLLEKTFHLDSIKRETIKNVLKSMIYEAEHTK